MQGQREQAPGEPVREASHDVTEGQKQSGLLQIVALPTHSAHLPSMPLIYLCLQEEPLEQGPEVLPDSLKSQRHTPLKSQKC